MRDVLFVPSLAYNLLSVARETENGITIPFDNYACHIIKTTGGSLAELDCEIWKAVPSEVQSWKTSPSNKCNRRS